MGYMYEFPHTANFDSDLRQIIELFMSVKELPAKYDTLQENFDELKLFVTNYFKDLDVQDEINEKLDAMLADGSLLTLFSSCIINVKQYGAKGDGVTDDTAAINRAIEAHNNNGAPIFIPTGTYIIKGVLSAVTTAGEIYGIGTLKGTAINKGYMLVLKAKVKVNGITFETTGYDGAIMISGTRQASIEYCTIVSTDGDGILLNTSSQCIVKDTYIVHCINGIVIQSDNVDTGDNYFFGNTFDCSDGTGKNALLFKSGGGIRFSNNKVLTYYIAININSTYPTSVILIDGNSMENGDIALNIKNSGAFGRIVFSDNQVTKYKIMVLDNAYEVAITGNIITGINTQNSIAIAMQNTLGGITIENNLITGFQYSVYNYTYAPNVRVANNNCDDFCRKATINSNAIFDEVYDKTVPTTGQAFNLGLIKPNINGSCIVDITLNGATNKYAMIRLKDLDGSVSMEKIHGDLDLSCTTTGVIVINESGTGDTYVNTIIKGSVLSIEH